MHARTPKQSEVLQNLVLMQLCPERTKTTHLRCYFTAHQPSGPQPDYYLNPHTPTCIHTHTH
eukprot:c4686_g1_i1 orf=2-184(-)